MLGPVEVVDEGRPMGNTTLPYASELQTPRLAARCRPNPTPASRRPTTFLFGDLVTSTQRWEGGPEAMTVDLALHDELLRSSTEAAGGEVISHTGDGMAAAFTAAPHSVAAAVAAQRALEAATWGDLRPLPVRMAIHAGVAQRWEGNYFGPALKPGRTPVGDRLRRPGALLLGSSRANRDRLSG